MKPFSVGDRIILVLTVPIKTVSEMNQREHWSSRNARRRSQKLAVWAAIESARGRRERVPGLPATVVLTRIAPRLIDSDNAVSAMKAVRDGVACAYRVDDRDSDETLRWEYAQRIGKPMEYAVEIRIESR